MQNDTTKGVYCLTFSNGKRYVGIGMGTFGIKTRWDKYKGLHNSIKSCVKLYNALKKYGPENVKYEVVLKTDDVEKAKKVEQQLIALWGLQNDKFGYNINAGGDYSRLGIKVSQETKDKISKTLTGRKLSYPSKLIGRIVSKEEIEKRRIKLIGQKRSDETKLKMSKWKRKSPSLELRLQISNSLKGRKRDPKAVLKSIETKQKNRNLCPKK